MAFSVATLEQAIQECADNCLFASAEWLTELYASLPPETSATTSEQAPRPQRCPDESKLTIARTYFRTKQLMRAAFCLKTCRSEQAIFVRTYCKFLTTIKQQNFRHITSLRTPPHLPFKIRSQLYKISCEIDNKTDPFNLFLRGLLFFCLGRRVEAVTALIQCVNVNPWIWSAWGQLAQILRDPEEFAGLQSLLPEHPMARLFSMKVMIDLHSPSEEDMQIVEELLDLFPSSNYLLTQKALIHYHQKDWDLAEHLFDYIFLEDPCRIDGMDIYSNILYVAEKRAKLSKLSRCLLELDKDRPEVCCVVGNYYSLRGDHERAIKYFRKALHLDRTYIPACTLMGHEHIELKHSEEAIESYRSGIDLDRMDYRAWFGLGQAYELLSMHNYALHYYQRAIALRPYDVRVWQAAAMCYSDLSRPKEAIECYKRAQIGADPEETVLHLKIASLYDALGDYQAAASYHRQVIGICRKAGRPVADYAKSCIYIARFYLHTLPQTGLPIESESRQTNLAFAKEYLRVVSESNAEEVGIAADLLRRLNGLSLTS